MGSTTCSLNSLEISISPLPSSACIHKMYWEIQYSTLEAASWKCLILGHYYTDDLRHHSPLYWGQHLSWLHRDVYRNTLKERHFLREQNLARIYRENCHIALYFAKLLILFLYSSIQIQCVVEDKERTKCALNGNKQEEVYTQREEKWRSNKWRGRGGCTPCTSPPGHTGTREEGIMAHYCWAPITDSHS